MTTLLVVIAAATALMVSCTTSQEQPTPTATPPTGGPDPMLVETLAARTEPAGDISVVGYVVVEPSRARLCDILLESFPPQCGPASVSISGYEGMGIEFEEAQGIVWTEDKVAFRGSWDGEVFMPTGLLD